MVRAQGGSVFMSSIFKSLRSILVMSILNKAGTKDLAKTLPIPGETEIVDVVIKVEDELAFKDFPVTGETVVAEEANAGFAVESVAAVLVFLVVICSVGDNTYDDLSVQDC
ncbi:hypothetical protein BGZ68_000189 [Mortierella alpina]|nr:hypothetical protein BGZ68_000189 [Mortierella alpina]